MQARRFAAPEGPRPGSLLVRLERGEELLESLRSLARSETIPGAAVSGLGAVGEATLAFYDLASRRYLETRFQEDLEVVSLTGNLSWLGAEPVVHLHAVLSRPDASTAGGHVMRAVVSVTLELMLALYPARVERRRVEAVGLNLLDLQ